MSLAKDYCRELLRELDQFPVYMPGRNVQVGDVITFRRDGLFARPLGDFQLVTSLGALEVNVQTRMDENSETYRYASQQGTSVSFSPEVNADRIDLPGYLPATPSLNRAGQAMLRFELSI